MDILKPLLDQFQQWTLDDAEYEQLYDKLKKQYPEDSDPWGFSLDKALKILKLTYPLYKGYFKTRLFGAENIEDKAYIVISNHTGQIALDGMLICTAFATELEKPRVLRPMVERFFSVLPFLGAWAYEGGAVLGDRQNCDHLLRRNQSVLVFPEGVKGIAKSTSEYYKLQHFTRGFFRMALTNNVEILPLAVVGAEEFYPYVYQAKGLARLLSLPALPISPNWVPLPSPVDIHVGKPFKIPEGISAESPDKDIDLHIKVLKKQIEQMVNDGLESRREFYFNKKV
jgi:1-acyl-sn-glycerol-3-phosphate acyltransferase